MKRPFGGTCFATSSQSGNIPRRQAGVSETMNRFDLQYWEGAREAALAIYEYVNDRKDIPEDVRAYVARVLRESGERKNKGFREELQLPPPQGTRPKAR